jgi:hypothetical protein
LNNWQFENTQLYKNVRAMLPSGTRIAGIITLMLKTHINATTQLIALCYGHLYRPV